MLLVIPLEKSHKYIRRWLSNGEWHYEYPSDQQRGTNRTNAKIKIARSTPIITGIKPLDNATIQDVEHELVRLNLMSLSGELKCPALGNSNIYVTGRTQDHIMSTRGKQRSPDETMHKARYLPFVKEILMKGKICEKSSSKKGVIYGVIGQVKYFDRKKGRNVVEAVELAINFDEQSKKYVFSFADKTIKKSLPDSRDFGNFSACQIVDTETVPITAFSISDDPPAVKSYAQRVREILQ